MQERYLVDTMIFLWWLTDRSRLSAPVYEILVDQESEIYISAASIWEIDIKRGLGELSLDNLDVNGAIEEYGFHKLEVSPRAAKIAKALPSTQQDPFNRTIIAQAIKNKLILMTSDDSITEEDELKVMRN